MPSQVVLDGPLAIVRSEISIGPAVNLGALTTPTGSAAQARENVRAHLSRLVREAFGSNAVRVESLLFDAGPPGSVEAHASIVTVGAAVISPSGFIAGFHQLGAKFKEPVGSHVVDVVTGIGPGDVVVNAPRVELGQATLDATVKDSAAAPEPGLTDPQLRIARRIGLSVALGLLVGILLWLHFEFDLDFRVVAVISVVAAFLVGWLWLQWATGAHG